MSGCTFHFRTRWRLSDPLIVREGWRMEVCRCDICGEHFTRRYSRAPHPEQHCGAMMNPVIHHRITQGEVR